MAIDPADTAELVELVLNNVRGKADIRLLELSHSAFPEPIYISNQVDDGTEFELEDSTIVTSMYFPFSTTDEDQGAILISNKDVGFEGVNDILAEYEEMIPRESTEKIQVIERRFVGRKDRTISGVAEKSPVLSARSILYSERRNAALLKATTEPTNQSPTGRRYTRSRFPTLKGFV